MTKPLTFPGVSADLRGTTVAVIARTSNMTVPQSAFAVHLNRCLGWETCPRCDELFTVINEHLLANAGKQFAQAAILARAIRVRMGAAGFERLEKLCAGISGKCSTVSINNHDPRHMPYFASTGLLALCYYRARGANVVPVGFSRDRKRLHDGSYHIHSAEWETGILNTFPNCFN